MRKLVITCSENPQELSIAMELIVEFEQEQIEYDWLHITRDRYLNMEFPIADSYRKFRFKRNIKRRFNGNFKEIILENLPEFETTDTTLKDAALKSALTEIISTQRNSEPCLHCNSDKLLEFTDYYLRVYNYILQIILNNDFESIYIYNGRFLLQSAIWRSAYGRNPGIVFFEKINITNPQKYYLFYDTVHSPIERAEAIQKLIDVTDKSDEEIQKIGSEWFFKRINGLSQNFTKNQSEKFIKANHNKTLVSFFHSSEDELIQSSLVDDKFGNQFKILENLADYFSTQLNVEFTIRMHPNLKYKDKKEIRKWSLFLTSLSQKYSNLTVIHHEEHINSYSLISESDLILTAGSLIAVESAFLRKSNVILGSSLHSEVGTSYVCDSIRSFKTSFEGFLKNNEANTRYTRAVEFGFFQEEGGITFRNLVVNNSGSLFTFNKRVYGNDKIYILFQKLSKLKKRFLSANKLEMRHKC
jgi:hypothetical protein